MAIEVKSDQWTGTGAADSGAASGDTTQICGEFHSPDKLDEAMDAKQRPLTRHLARIILDEAEATGELFDFHP